MTSKSAPTILFGAFDRHNFGDLLFPHIVARLLDDKELIFAGLAERDLRNVGGHQVRAIARLAEEFAEAPVNVIHVGGELLGCDAWQAAVMLQSPEEARQLIDRLENHPSERVEWARQQLHLLGQAPYTVPRALFPSARKVIYNAIGGTELAARDASFRREVISNLKGADWISVREHCTQELLTRMGLETVLMPDPAVMVASLFTPEIERAAQTGQLATLHTRFPQGYLAVQFSADFGDDATLMALAEQLEGLSSATGYGVVLFRAGAAPWHDDLECYRRLIGHMHRTQAAIFHSLNLWEICALIAHSRGYCGSSLHGRIVAMAYALPRLNLCRPQQEQVPSKQSAYAAAWDLPEAPTVVATTAVREGMLQALGQERTVLQAKAQALVNCFRQGFQSIRELLGD